ncbi:DUF4395 domain-containing protein [Geofilum sp. OHC36d9]|uniref:DUF4395 domain-containing protein n=1 Tax=Geofilum sp. OHC36d9 TaxID=3458413 RepID=UPI0040339D88
MKTYAFCPISERKINEQVARINAAFTVLFLIVFAYTGSLWFMAFMVIDFLLRGSSLAQYSLVGITSKQIVKLLPVEVQLINAGPKIFAARIGLLLTSVVLVATLFGLNTLALAVAGVLGLFSFLEAAFGFCVACKIYPFVYGFFYK